MHFRKQMARTVCGKRMQDNECSGEEAFFLMSPDRCSRKLGGEE